eukprot:TRINITY_DN20318_c0_g1_i1.p1 TRINITY_DN20318_c0_g1~~TRINITY_DN20318_c0_g1_i1.p1  ORF type:complete len:414 (+),score=59.86 TRINITY_DN20318_c0_g1_i1:74-1243(+)
MSLVALVVAVAAGFASGFPRSDLRERLQTIATDKSPHWNRSGIEITFRDDVGVVAVAGGFEDEQSHAKATPGDAVLFGSVTKMVTAAATLQLVERGILSLDSMIVNLVDDYFKTRNGTTLTNLWNNSFITTVTLRDLLRMTSGIPDYDTDALRKYQTDNPSVTITPWDVVHMANKSSSCPPGNVTCASYSSTNYVLVGFVLAAHHNVSWADLDQRSVLPTHSDPSIYKTLQFIKSGSLENFNNPSKAVVSHGYQPDGSDVWKMSASGGWTCGNMLSGHLDVTQFLIDYLKDHVILSEKFMKKEVLQFHYLPELHLPYGLGIQNVTLNDSGILYGHLGSTYGFYSAALFNTKHNYTLVMSMNFEQPQPWSGMWDVMSVVIGNITAMYQGQ